MAYLFFFGTLAHEHDAPLSRLVMRLLGPGRRARTRGRLLAVHTRHGCYPALIRGRGWVEGWVYKCGPHFGRAALRTIDRYEEFDSARPRRSEYVRRACAVRLTRGPSLVAQVYCWNKPTHAGMSPVPGGNFARFLARTRRQAYGLQ